MDEKTIFEKSVRGRRGVGPDPLDVPEVPLPGVLQRSTPLELTELSEPEVVRHFTRLSKRNFGVDSHFYPLGSCTMKYNPKIAEAVARLQGFTDIHPHLSSVEAYLQECQGALELVFEVERTLAEVAGMHAACLQPMAGAHGELTGVLMIAAYHRQRCDSKRNVVLIPDSAHGTNPASAAMAGFRVDTIPSTREGVVDFDRYTEMLNENVAAVMLTCPNTHGLFEARVTDIAESAHRAGALMYYDGANLNAIIGQCRPGELGFDVMHFNLHKTFGTPHGMGGPGSGAIAVGEILKEFLPGPRIMRQGEGYTTAYPPHSIGRMAPFFGNFLVAVRAMAFLLKTGDEGLRQVSRMAVLHANYVLARIGNAFDALFPAPCMHECVLSAASLAEKHGVRALDIAKALLDRGFHAPTVYFPLTVREGMMIEPTETESKETLDAFCDAMLELAGLAAEQPDFLRQSPHTTPVGRLDEVKAARTLDCACLPSQA